MNRDGGYDSGYRACPCFWGEQPGSLIKLLPKLSIIIAEGSSVWDAGCGEGKNAIFLARQGAAVLATDVSIAAIENARQYWPDSSRVLWQNADVLEVQDTSGRFDLVVMYGLLHCLPNQKTIEQFVNIAKLAVRPGGAHVLVTFNNRNQELHAHPGFSPTLLPDSFYRGLYADWSVLHHTDSDLRETHPHNDIPHTHSMTRLVAREPQA